MVPTGRNADMVKWGDHVMRIGDSYINEQVSPLLEQLGYEVSQVKKPEAQAAMAQLGVYAHRIPLVAGSEISQAQDPNHILRAVNDRQTGQHLATIEYLAPWVDRSLTRQLRQALSDQAMRENVLIPAAQQAGLVQ